MPPFGPISRLELVRGLRAAGFDGPYSGGKHPYMIKAKITLTLPNVHRSEIGKELLARILRQAEISKDDLEKL